MTSTAKLIKSVVTSGDFSHHVQNKISAELGLSSRQLKYFIERILKDENPHSENHCIDVLTKLLELQTNRFMTFYNSKFECQTT